jgi:hypothetical protein
VAKQHYHVHTPDEEKLFHTKKEAEEWMREYLEQSAGLDRAYADFVMKICAIPCRKACKVITEEN